MMKNTLTFKTAGLLAALSLTTLLAACGGGGGGGTTTGPTGTVTPTAASALLQINGQNTTSNTNTVTSLDQIFVTATVPVKWTFTATLPNGQPDTSIPTVTGGTFPAISSLPGTEPTTTQVLPANGTSFYLIAPPGDVVTLTLTDASSGTVLNSYEFDVNSALAGTWPTMSYTQASGTYDVGNCSFTVSSVGVINGICTSSNIAGETFTITGKQGWSSQVAFTGSNGWSFTGYAGTTTSMAGQLGSAGSWNASR
jgi:hypothetical protein